MRENRKSVSQIFSELSRSPYTVYGDEGMNCIAFVSHPPNEVPVLSRLVITRDAVMNNILDNVWAMIRKDYRRLVWTARADDENRAWHFEHADGSFTRNRRSLFYYGIQDVGEVEQTMRELERLGRIERAYLPLNMRRTTDAQQKRGFTSWARASSVRPQLASPAYEALQQRTYATAAPKRVALVGARGFTGRSLVQLINEHPHLELSHVLSLIHISEPTRPY